MRVIFYFKRAVIFSAVIGAFSGCQKEDDLSTTSSAKESFIDETSLTDTSGTEPTCNGGNKGHHHKPPHRK